MDINQIPLFSMLQNKLGYLAERQKFIAENVANSSTPGFTPQDLKPFADQPGVGGKPGPAPVTLAPTEGSEQNSGGDGQEAGASGFISLAASGKSSKGFVSLAMPDSETTLNGNQVVLEEQMLKLNDARSDYDTAIGFYEKAMNMLHMAVKKPGS